MVGDYARSVAVFIMAYTVFVAVRLTLVARTVARRRGSWRAVFDRSRCRGCGEPCPVVQVPTSVRQALRSGWTCQRCRLDCDMWGEAVPTAGRR